MQSIVIIGAGAIGRGFLPWLIPQDEYELIYVDSNPTLIQTLQQQKYFHTYKVSNDTLLQKKVFPKSALLPEQFNLSDYPNCAAVFINVGPRNCIKAAQLISHTTSPVIFCENEMACVTRVKNNTTIKNCFFGIPDVITSNSAPMSLRAHDALSIITEEGVLFLDEGAKITKIDAVFCNHIELEKQWIAKLYLHNTPHCVAAYLGALAHFTYLHETMEVSALETIIKGAMNEMLQALKLRWAISHDFLDWYAEKELKRFKCRLLHDPISRVAREPARKLALDGRLVGAAQLCLSHGFVPENILIGIACALLFSNNQDPDQHLPFLRKHLDISSFLAYILGLRKGEALEIILSTRLDSIIEKTLSIIKSLPKQIKPTLCEQTYEY